MIEAIAEFTKLIEMSHNGSVPTDSKTYFLAAGLSRLAQILEKRLDEVDRINHDNLLRLQGLERDITRLEGAIDRIVRPN
jgi:hypothetical protein